MLARLRDLRSFLAPPLAAAFAIGLLGGTAGAADVRTPDALAGTVTVVSSPDLAPHQDPSHHDHHHAEALVDPHAHDTERHGPADHHAGHGCDACTCFAATGGCSVPLPGMGPKVGLGTPAIAYLAAGKTSSRSARTTFDIFRPPRH